MIQRIMLPLAAALVAACAPPPPPPAPPAPPPPPPFVAPAPEVWTAGPGVVLASDTGSVALPRPFTRLRVLDGDSLSLLVRCDLCPDTARGRVARAQVVFGAPRPDSAAAGSLAEFALAVRVAAARGDLGAIRPVLAPDFVFSWVGEQSPDAAVAAWRAEGLRTLAQLPALLDGGLVTRDSTLWLAPPEYAESLAYQGLRLGFRRNPAGRWEWLFLIRGEGSGGDGQVEVGG